MDKESTYDLQKIDCNCNNCGYMLRDFEMFRKWEQFHLEIELAEFNRKKGQLLASPSEEEKAKGRAMVFQFEKKYLMNYGLCNNRESLYANTVISFIPNVCQLNTQQCFKHRKDMNL